MNLFNIYSLMHQSIRPSIHPSIIHISIQLTHKLMHSFFAQSQSCTHLISFVTFLSFIHSSTQKFIPLFTQVHPCTFFLFSLIQFLFSFLFFFWSLQSLSPVQLLFMDPVHWTFQARVLEWTAVSSSGESSRPKDGTSISCISCMTGRFFTH